MGDFKLVSDDCFLQAAVKHFHTSTQCSLDKNEAFLMKTIMYIQVTTEREKSGLCYHYQTTDEF